MELQNIQTITSHYNLTIKCAEKLSERVFLIVSDHYEKFILKEKNDSVQINREMHLLHHLQTNHLPVHSMIINNNGEYYTHYGNKYYSLYDHIEGSTFNALEMIHYPNKVKVVGSAIADLNNAMKKLSFSELFPNKNLYQMVYSFAVHEIVKADSSDILMRIFKELDEEIHNIVRSIPKQLIHRDAHIYNMIVNDESLKAFIDFDLAEINVSTFDLCYCSTSILSEVFINPELRKNWFTFVQELVNSYSEHKPLSDVEKQSIWYIMLCIQSIFMAYFSHDKNLYSVNKKMFLWIYNNRKNIEQNVSAGIFIK
ncbi:phosphotransferase [Jeotgalibacillus aurantiacus]|uniref:phosphotransferase n=1 Tax=Jeotgalibacillus aurantiacus TaxID=2763266 RepID=UPI001D0B19F8|nr:phosphotransferase [Jeotgalibacillus aurantiacus]